MSVFKYKYDVFSFSFIHLPIGSDSMISMLYCIECSQRTDIYYLIFG